MPKGEDTSWEELAREWANLPTYDHETAPNRVRKEAQAAMLGVRDRALRHARRHPEAFWNWFLALPQIPRPNRLPVPLSEVVLWHWRTAPVPKRAFKALLDAGIHERDPSFNRTFIEPLTRAYGWRVVRALTEVLEKGSAEDKAGAANALYWARGFAHEVDPDKGSATRDVQRHALLRQFVECEDLHVRRAILGKLSLEAAHYPSDMHPLITRAIEIARTSGDDYLKHRIEIQLGSGGPYMALPDRPPEKTG